MGQLIPSLAELQAMISADKAQVSCPLMRQSVLLLLNGWLTKLQTPHNPVNITPPVITSNADLTNPHPGDILSSTTGTWAPAPTTYQYQWYQRQDFGGGTIILVAIIGATSSTYTIQNSDLPTDPGYTVELLCKVGTNHLMNAVESNHSGDVTPSDPLAGFPFLARWQTHVPGDNALLGNLFQDSGLTTPVTTAGDPVGGFESVLGITANMLQTTNLLRPALAFDTLVPCVSFNGSVSFTTLPDLTVLTEGEIFVLFKPLNTADGNLLYSMSGLGADPATYLPFSGDGKFYDSFGTTVRKDAITASVTSGWNIYNASSKNGEWRNALNGVELFSTATNTASWANAANPVFGGVGATFWTGGKVIAVFLFNAVLTIPQRAAVNAYLASLHP